MVEVWKDIPGYEGRYKVSNLGLVKSMPRLIINHRKGTKKTTQEKILKPTKDKGYYKVGLSKNGKTKNTRVHTIVAICFLSHEPSGMSKVVDHINNDKTDNRAENLQIISQRENSSKDRKGGTSKYIGVSWSISRRKWLCQMTINGKQTNLGCFTDEKDAAQVYQEKLKEITNA